ncbi:hypothetical protein ACA910_006704 [Epithemia clementina (nom. ined.)]
MRLNEPWSSKHKHMFQGCPYSLSNSFAEPLTQQELIDQALARGDDALVDEYQRHHTLTYTPNGGSHDLRLEIAKLYGPNITADHVIVCAGAQVALQTAALAILAQARRRADDDNNNNNKDNDENENDPSTVATPKCHSIVFTPGYQSTIEAPLQAGSRITKVQRHASNQWQIKVQDVRDAIQEDTKLILLNEPYNPAGTLMSRETQQELVALADEHDIIMLCDEVYRFLEHDPSTDRIPAMADAYRQGISVVTLSKPWGGCGITIGWLAFQDLSLRQTLLDTLYFGTACPSRASELQAIMTLRASDWILSRNLKIVRSNWILLQTVIEQEYPEWLAWIPPTAGAIAFVQFKGPFTSHELGRQLAERGISIKPAFCFSNTLTPELAQYFRVGYGESIMPQALQKLVDFIKEHKDQWKATMEARG